MGWDGDLVSYQRAYYVYTIPGQASSIKRVYFMLWGGIVHFECRQAIQLLQI